MQKVHSSPQRHFKKTNSRNKESNKDFLRYCAINTENMFPNVTRNITSDCIEIKESQYVMNNAIKGCNEEKSKITDIILLTKMNHLNLVIGEHQINPY